MENYVQETSAEPVIEITQVGGDLRVTGWEQNQVVAESDDAQGVSFEQDGDQLRVAAQEDLTIRVPQAAQLSVRTVGGDARVIRMTSQKLAIGNVGGDLSLRQIGSANVGVVGGDVKAKHVLGDLQVGHAGGDLEAREVAGAFKSGNIGGDLYLVGVEGPIQAISGGDTTLSVTFKPEQEYSVQAGSDLSCRVGPEASARLTLMAGGEIELEVPAAQVSGNGNRKTVTLGSGAAVVSLRAGGDLQLTSQGYEAERLGDFGERFGKDFAAMAEEFGARIESTIEAQMADFDRQMSEGLAGINFGPNPADAAKIAANARRAAERVQRATQQEAEAARRRAEKEAERAGRIAEAAQRRAEAINRRVQQEHGRRGWPFGGDAPRPAQPPRPPAPPRPFASAPATEPVSDEERMMILHMVEQGKISVADAEKLLAALENK
jgi:hypothetical protein